MIDYRSQEYTRQEQTYLNGLRLLDLPKFTFLVAACQEEGTLPTTLQRVSIAHIDAGEYVDTERVTEARRRLMRRDGRAVADVLAEIASRQAGCPSRGEASLLPPQRGADTRPALPRGARTRRREPLS